MESSPFNEIRGAPGQGAESSGQMRQPDDQKPSDWPRFKLTERHYINDVMRQVGEEVILGPKDIPSRHMEPLNDAAKALWMQHKERLTRDPLAHLMIAPSEYELKPHTIKALEAFAAQMGFEPGKNPQGARK